MFATAPRVFLGDWLARLTARLAIARDEIRRGIVEAVGRTAAEAAEGTLAELIGRWRPALETQPREIYEPRWDDDYDDGDDEDDPEPEPEEAVIARAPRRWRALFVAALHGLAWWLPRRCPNPVVAAAAAIVGAVVLLID